MHAAVIIKYTCKAGNCCKIASRYIHHILYMKDLTLWEWLAVPEIEQHGVHCTCIYRLKNKLVHTPKSTLSPYLWSICIVWKIEICNCFVLFLFFLKEKANLIWKQNSGSHVSSCRYHTHYELAENNLAHIEAIYKISPTQMQLTKWRVILIDVHMYSQSSISVINNSNTCFRVGN